MIEATVSGIELGGARKKALMMLERACHLVTVRRITA
jgi:hypothetical protein